MHTCIKVIFMVEKKIVQKISIPQKVGVEVKEDNHLTLTSDKGKLSRHFKTHRLKFKQEGNNIIIEGSPINKQTRALMMTSIAHIKNMVKGLLYGYKYEMKVVYSHFPMTLQTENGFIFIKNFLGEKFPRKAKIVGETKIEVKGQDVILSGINLEEVSQTAANIELATKVKKKDIRRFMDGVYTAEKGTMEEEQKEHIIEIVSSKE